ncbi:hypothetical protein [Rhizobium sp. FKY42]|uniref:hypothetical protein n=1 Tax=Rhizobium sp. FKY42 TaxID=2562310 RepID=UPI0010C01222|nr:hypothetical protein [Rhizobium sp. FKY42]
MQVVVFRRTGRSDLAEGVDLLTMAARSLSVSGNTLAHLFFALGVAAIFSLEYRYLTWRHLVPRQSRFWLCLAKFVTAALCLAFSLLFVAAADGIVTLLTVGMDEHPILSVFTVDGLATFAMAFASGMLELLVLLALTALLTIAFRSAMVAVLTAFLVTLASVLVQAYIGSPQELWWLPAVAANEMRDATFTPNQPGLLLSATILVGWVAILGGASFFIFQRQELANE